MMHETDLRPYQHLIIDHIIETPKCGVWSFMGSGKSIATLTAIDRLKLAGDTKPVLVVAPLRVARDVWPDEIHKWEHVRHLRVSPILGTKVERIAAMQTPADVYTINFENLEWLIGLLWDRWPFGMIVIDECFLPGTPVDTPTGAKAIETIRPGDKILNAYGVDTVVGTHTVEAHEIVCVTVNGHSLYCSLRHLFFTERGWVAAHNLVEGDEIYARDECVRMVQSNTSMDAPSAEVLREILLSEMAHAAAGSQREGAQPVGMGKNIFRTDSIFKQRYSVCEGLSYQNRFIESRKGVIRGDTSTSVIQSKENELEAHGAWWEWQGSDASGIVTEEQTRIRMDQRARGSFEASWIFSRRRVPELLQNRRWQSAEDDQRRGRRTFSSSDTSQKSRCKKGTRPCKYRVDGIAIYQSGSREFNRFSGGKNTITLYDLEINIHPSYSVCNLLVHNCTKLKSLRASVKKHPKTGTEFVSGKGASRAKAFLKVLYQHKPERVVELTGTPAAKGLKDLWGQIYFLDYGARLGNTYDAFINRWFQRDFDGFSVEPQPHASKEIHEKLRDICLALKSEDWFDLEKPILRDIFVDLPPTARKQYRDMEKTLLADIEGHKIEAFNAGARTMKCRQMAAGACYLGDPNLPGERKWVESHTAKLDALEEIVEEWSGAPILVAYNFKSDLARLLKRFPKGRVLDQKSSTIKEWNEGKIPLLFTHPESAGHGLNLQYGGNILVYFSFDWKVEPYSQVAERIGPVRQAQAGFKRNVYIYRIVARNTVDEDVISVIENNLEIQDVLMNSLKRRAAS